MSHYLTFNFKLNKNKSTLSAQELWSTVQSSPLPPTIKSPSEDPWFQLQAQWVKKSNGEQMGGGDGFMILEKG